MRASYDPLEKAIILIGASSGFSANEIRTLKMAAYFRVSPDKPKKIYVKYMPYLTIQKEADISESSEYLRIKHENQILQVETARHVVERSELQKLRIDMQKMRVFLIFSGFP